MHIVMPHAPHFAGTTDASKDGMGGCWTPLSMGYDRHNYLWGTPFNQNICDSLTTACNTAGMLTNSNLELAAIVVSSTTITQHIAMPHAHIYLASNNTPAMSWVNKGSTTSDDPAAYLLHQLAQHRCCLPYYLSTIYTPGLTNTIADFCSQHFNLSDSNFLHAMNTMFPVKLSWTLVYPTFIMISVMNSTLLRKLHPL
jgi:hypothetical protein